MLAYASVRSIKFGDKIARSISLLSAIISTESPGTRETRQANKPNHLTRGCIFRSKSVQIAIATLLLSWPRLLSVSLSFYIYTSVQQHPRQDRSRAFHRRLVPADHALSHELPWPRPRASGLEFPA